jgi:hypothetical protein
VCIREADALTDKVVQSLWRPCVLDKTRARALFPAFPASKCDWVTESENGTTCSLSAPSEPPGAV